MNIRKTTRQDIKEVMVIVDQAKAYFKANGIDQWQNGYPNEASIEADIALEESYVLLEDDIIIGTAMLSFAKEETYDWVEDGAFLTDGAYAVIHRMAVYDSKKGKNIAGILLDYFEKKCLEKGVRSIKVDTHTDNKSMQEFLKKKGFVYCGIIYLADGAARVAFEKII